MVNKKKSECLSAFPSEEFCECISKNTSVGITFSPYIAIVTHTKDELKYGTISNLNKQMVDINRACT